MLYLYTVVPSYAATLGDLENWPHKRGWPPVFCAPVVSLGPHVEFNQYLCCPVTFKSPRRLSSLENGRVDFRGLPPLYRGRGSQGGREYHTST